MKQYFKLVDADNSVPIWTHNSSGASVQTGRVVNPNQTILGEIKIVNAPLPRRFIFLTPTEYVRGDGFALINKSSVKSSFNGALESSNSSLLDSDFDKYSNAGGEGGGAGSYITPETIKAGTDLTTTLLGAFGIGSGSNAATTPNPVALPQQQYQPQQNQNQHQRTEDDNKFLGMNKALGIGVLVTGIVAIGGLITWLALRPRTVVVAK